MSKKSLLYLGAGALFVLYVLLDVLTVLLMPSLQQGAMVELNVTLIPVLLPLAVGLMLITKAFLSDKIPNIILVGLFGLLALLNVVHFFGFLRFIINNAACGFMDYLILASYFFEGVAYGSMAAIILFKDSFGGFFFVPAAVVAINACISFLVNAFGLFGMPRVGFFPCIISLAFNFVLVAALFAAGLANNEE